MIPISRNSRVLMPCLLIASIVIGTGCSPKSAETGATSSGATETLETVPDSALLTFRWIDTDAVDLRSSDGTFIRAAVESWELAQYAEDLSAGYPGFADAMQDANYDFEGYGRAPDDTVVGTSYYQIVGLDELADDVARVWYCPIINLVGTTTNSQPNAPGEFEVGSGSTTTSVVPLLYQRTLKDGVEQLPPSQMEGPGSSPTNDVFGSWTVLSTSLGDVDTPSPPVESCEPKAPGTPVEWSRGAQYSDTPPVAQPPYPGWPTDGS